MTIDAGGSKGEDEARARRFVDVTLLLGTRRLTGIQRVELNLFGGESGWVPVCFDEGRNEFRTVSNLPSVARFGSKRSAFGRRLESRLYLSFALVARVLASIRMEALLDLLVVTTRRAYGLLHARRQVDSRGNWPLAGIRPDFSGEIFFLMEIPRSEKHLAALAKVQREAKFISYVYDLIPVDSPSVMSAGSAQKFSRQYERYLRLVLNSHRVLCLSGFTQGRLEAFALRNNFSHPPLEVLYPPVLSPQAKTSTPLVTERKSELGRSQRVLAVGAFNRRKNLIVLGRAVESLLRQGVNLELTVVSPFVTSVDYSTVKLFKELRKSYPHRVRVFYDLPDAELDELFRQADTVVVPSLVEGLGLPVVEGLLAGCRVIASKAEVFVELADKLPVSLFETQSFRSLENQLLDPSRPNVEAAISSVRTTFPTPREFLSELTGG